MIMLVEIGAEQFATVLTTSSLSVVKMFAAGKRVMNGSYLANYKVS